MARYSSPPPLSVVKPIQLIFIWSIKWAITIDLLCVFGSIMPARSEPNIMLFEVHYNRWTFLWSALFIYCVFSGLMDCVCVCNRPRVFGSVLWLLLYIHMFLQMNRQLDCNNILWHKCWGVKWSFSLKIRKGTENWFLKSILEAKVTAGYKGMNWQAFTLHIN